MKKIILGIISIACVFSLVACSNTNTNNNNELNNNQENQQQTPIQEENNKNDIELVDVYNSIISSQPEEKRDELVFFPETDSETINSFYPGLSDISLKQEEIYMPAVTGFAQEIALVEVENADDVEKVKEIFNKRIEQGKEEGACDPDVNKIWERNAVVQVKGNYVAMIALPDGYTIPEDVFAK